MKITLSKSQWQNIGKKAGWIKEAQSMFTNTTHPTHGEMHKRPEDSVSKEIQEKWYTEEVAFDPNTSPDILRKILERGKDDLVSRYASDNPKCPPDALSMVLKRRKNDRVSVNATRNPNCPPDALSMVLKRGKDDWVSQNAADNPKCPPDALTMVLKRGKDDMVSWCAAKNPKCPPDALTMVLKRGKGDNVSCGAAENPNCLPDTLFMVLKRGKDDHVSMNAARNPKCPPGALKTVLERGKDDSVSRCAVINPNCPPLAKIQWMRATGRIGIEDPTKHIIEKEEVKPDKDLQKLRDMVSFNLNNYKTVQESWRSRKVASNPITSDIQYGKKAGWVPAGGWEDNPPLSPSEYEYHINLNERGSFYADVRDSSGKTVFEIKAGNELGEGEASIFEDGFMKNIHDMNGLKAYLVELGIMMPDQRLKDIQPNER